jgi:nucleoside-diphosphate-sugar epimerase
LFKKQGNDELMAKFSKVLVAGGAGFIGSHIVDRLIQEGIDVAVLDNFYSGNLANLKQHKGKSNLHLIEGDVRNLDLVRKAVKDIDAVFNDAAVVSIPRSMENPILANEVNVGGTLNLLKASLDSGVKRLVQASSASVYGNTEKLPVIENYPPKPIAPYAVSELAAESYARVFYSCYGLETVCLRYFNVYGPRQPFNAYSGVITIFMNQLLQDKQPIVFGDGKQTRDFVYVDDIVQANMKALGSKKAVGEVINVATGTASSINKLLSNLQEIMERTDLKPIRKPSRKGDIRHSYASIEKAREILGYRPKFSLRKGLTELVKWYTNRK